MCGVCSRPIELFNGHWSHCLPVPLRDPAATGYVLGLFILAIAGHDAAPLVTA